jgi:hypothetical protein
MVDVSQAAATHCVSSKQVTEESDEKEYRTKPKLGAALVYRRQFEAT